MTDVVRNVRYAFRSLGEHKTFAAVAVLTLALGIGANSAIFSIVDAVLLHPLPYADASRLFVIYEQHPAPLLRTRISAGNFLDLQHEARSFDALGGYIGTGFTLSGGARRSSSPDSQSPPSSSTPSTCSLFSAGRFVRRRTKAAAMT
jgi:hypothetical protein